MFCCKAGHSIKKQILSIWYSKEPVVYQSVHYKNIFSESDFFVRLPSGINAITEVKSVSLTDEIVKYKLWKDDEKVTALSDEEMNNILHGDIVDPWLWIGATTIFGAKDMSADMKPFIVAGNTITTEILGEFFPWHYKWKYLDPQTFKEVEFPSEGITINAPRMEGIKETDEEVGSPK